MLDRGWFDVQGCGKCYDYCRFVGGFSSPVWRCVGGNAKGSWNELMGSRTVFVSKNIS
jgi:hypothetical protein